MNPDREGVYQRIDRLTGISGGFQQAVVLNTATELELFTLLDSRGPSNAEEVAAGLGLDERATDIMLHALAGMELLEVDRQHRFANAPIADELLVRGRPLYQGDIIRHNNRLMERWACLPEVLRSGKPADIPASTDDSDRRRDFILGMANIARLSAGKVADSLELSGARRMLDVGGGPGTYSIEFCGRNDNLEAVVFDLPEVIEEITTQQVKDSGLDDRIVCRGGDYMDDDMGSGYDLVLLSNIVHSLSDDDTLRLLERCAAAMEPGGRLVLKDFLLEEDRANPPFSSVFAVNMLVGTTGGKSYTEGETRSLLSRAGLEPGAMIDISPQARILVGVKPR